MFVALATIAAMVDDLSMAPVSHIVIPLYDITMCDAHIPFPVFPFP